MVYRRAVSSDFPFVFPWMMICNDKVVRARAKVTTR